MNWEQFKTGPGGTDLPSDVEPGESELIQAFERWIHVAHPNPERKGCPGRERLEAVVKATTKLKDKYTLDHIGQCAACLDEMKAIKREIARI